MVMDHDYKTNSPLMEQGTLYSKHSQKFQVVYGLQFTEPYLRPGIHVLDIGCGTGEIDEVILKKIGSSGYLYGIDPDEERIRIAEKLKDSFANVTFRVCKGSDLIMEDVIKKFDLVVSNTVFHWMDEKEKVSTLRNIWTALKPGGKCLIQSPTEMPVLSNLCLHLLGEKYFKNVHDKLFLTPGKILEDLCREMGFNILKSEPYLHDSYWSSTRELCEFFTASFYSSHEEADLTKIIAKVEESSVAQSHWKENHYIYSLNMHRLVLGKHTTELSDGI